MTTMLDISGQSCLVVGGGGVALRKVEGLLAEKAQVTVVALNAVENLIQLATAEKIVLKQRGYHSKEAAQFSLVFAATNNREVNRQIFQDAKKAQVWVNVVDDPELCTFHLPARVQRGPFQIAIASAGYAPFVVRRLRRLFEQRIGPEWAEWMQAAGRFRQYVRKLELPRVEQEKRYDKIFQATDNP